MVGDHFKDQWEPLKDIFTNPNPTYTFTTGVSQAEFDALKKEVEQMKALLKRAKIYDETNGEPNCELDEKMAFLRKVAELVGVNLDDVVPKKA